MLMQVVPGTTNIAPPHCIVLPRGELNSMISVPLLMYPDSLITLAVTVAMVTNFVIKRKHASLVVAEAK